MPPQQCPECGRFLKNALVEGLATAPAPCPKCAVELTADMFGLAGATAAGATDPGTTGAGTTGAGTPAVGTVSEGTIGAASVRPPDLRPDTVRDATDPLAGWDAGEEPPQVVDRRPFPTDTLLVAAGAGVGAVAGALTSDRHLRGSVAGALAGAVATGIVRRIWLLPDA